MESKGIRQHWLRIMVGFSSLHFRQAFKYIISFITNLSSMFYVK
jgi:hypothetical protein